MNVFETIARFGNGSVLVGVLVAAAYPALYVAFRLCGKLSVGTRGWHAGGVHFGRRVVLSALRLFGFFQPLLRLESGLARRFALFGGGRKREPKVSDVVVEVVSMT